MPIAQPNINLTTEYLSALERKMTIGPLVFGKGKAKYKFSGANKVIALSMRAYDAVDYDPLADGSRFGNIQDVEDDKHEYDVRYEKANNLALDIHYTTDQKAKKTALEVIKNQFNVKYYPMMDTLALASLANEAGTKVYSQSIDKDTIVTAVTAARKSMVNEKTWNGGKNKVIYITADHYEDALNATGFIPAEKVATKSLVEGSFGKLRGFSLIECPDSYFPEGVNFIAVDLAVQMDIKKFDNCRILKEHPDVDGPVVQPHFRFDTHIIETNNKACYVSYSTAAPDAAAV